MVNDSTRPTHPWNKVILPVWILIVNIHDAYWDTFIIPVWILFMMIKSQHVLIHTTFINLLILWVDHNSYCMNNYYGNLRPLTGIASLYTSPNRSHPFLWFETEMMHATQLCPMVGRQVLKSGTTARGFQTIGCQRTSCRLVFSRPISACFVGASQGALETLCKMLQGPGLQD